MLSASLDVGASTLTVTFDQNIQPTSITAGNFHARPSPGIRYLNSAFAHGGGSVIGPMPCTNDGGFGTSPRVDFRDIPSGELVNATTGPAPAELNFPLTVV